MKNVNTNYFSNLLAYGGRDIENQFWVLAAEITEAALTHLRKRSFFSSHTLPHRKTATAPSITCPKAVRDSQDIENYLWVCLSFFHWEWIVFARSLTLQQTSSRVHELELGDVTTHAFFKGSWESTWQKGFLPIRINLGLHTLSLCKSGAIIARRKEVFVELTADSAVVGVCAGDCGCLCLL